LRLGKLPSAVEDFLSRAIEAHGVVPSFHNRKAVRGFAVAAAELDCDGTVGLSLRSMVPWSKSSAEKFSAADAKLPTPSATPSAKNASLDFIDITMRLVEIARLTIRKVEPGGYRTLVPRLRRT
jgi:hypothetical protein